jgi:hypothetical protein
VGRTLLSAAFAVDFDVFIPPSPFGCELAIPDDLHLPAVDFLLK